jgi:sec-independent protein translocase protein TatB
MFDLSMVELGVIALVALLVLGPERLPKAARTLGFYVRKARQSWYSVRAEFERELAAEELKRSLKLDEVQATLDDTARSAREGLRLEAEAPANAANAPAAAARPADEAGTADAERTVAIDDDGLSPEERARQCEPLQDESLGTGHRAASPDLSEPDPAASEDPKPSPGSTEPESGAPTAAGGQP